jgi:hypothetical protein
MALTPVREALPDRLVDAPGILGGRSEKKSLRFKKRSSKEKWFLPLLCCLNQISIESLIKDLA